jgi:hypothetical protein
MKTPVLAIRLSNKERPLPLCKISVGEVRAIKLPSGHTIELDEEDSLVGIIKASKREFRIIESND